MILRILANAPLTTKGAELTWEELDGNLIKIFQDLSAKVKAGSIPDFDSATVYSLGDASNYDDRTWLYLNAVPAAGIDPGSDPAYWGDVDPTFFIHEKDKDTMLAKGTPDEVTAAALAALVAAGAPDTIFTGGIQTADSTIDQDGNTIIFKDGKILIGPTVSAAPVRLHVSGTTNGAIIAAVNEALSLIGAYGLTINSTTRAVTSLGPANLFRKEPTGSIPSPESSSLIDTYSPDQGVRIYPQTSDRTTIVDPVDGLKIYYIPLHRDEIYDPFFGWKPSGEITPDWGIRIHYESALGTGMFLDNDGGGTWERYNASDCPAILYAVKTANIAGESYASLSQGYAALKGSANKKMYKANIYPIDFNGGGADFIFVSGVVNDVYPSGWASGIFFLYDAPNQGGNWCCVVLTTGSGPTYIDSGVPVDGGSGDGLYRLKWTQDGEVVKFYINGALVGTVMDYVETGQFGITNEVYTAAGGVAKRIGIDFVEYIEKFDTPRYGND